MSVGNVVTVGVFVDDTVSAFIGYDVDIPTLIVDSAKSVSPI